MQNYWLNILDKKRLFKEVDEKGLEVWNEDRTLGDLFASLNDEQTDFLMNMKVRDFFSDSNEIAYGIELISP
jgi:hypothetical protein